MYKHYKVHDELLESFNVLEGPCLYFNPACSHIYAYETCQNISLKMIPTMCAQTMCPNGQKLDHFATQLLKNQITIVCDLFVFLWNLNLRA